MIFKMLLFNWSAAVCATGEKDKTRQLEKDHNHSCNYKLDIPVDHL